ncbi:MAG: tryptophan synthase subunit alpha [Firmicutes bacterium]|jgi:tryptophan synthase alpha chain|nr:tryptophan synthase subunit alpha [Bacillota bacterium]
MSRISDTFTRLKGEGRAALMPYITAGHPTLPATEALLFALEESGADMIELGIPYSDPLADGPTVQRAGQIALQNGATIPRIHAMMRRVREQGLSIPVLYMVYYNCVFRHGEERFLDEAAASGIDGLIIPDLPLEEAEEVEGLAAERGLDLVYLLAPTSTPERIAEAGRRSRGFIYCVSLTGVTGARDRLSAAIEPMLRRIREATSLPLAVGFGISRPEHAAAVAKLADGVIVGSALVERIDEAPDETEAVNRAAAYIRSLRLAVDQARFRSANVG